MTDHDEDPTNKDGFLAPNTRSENPAAYDTRHINQRTIDRHDRQRCGTRVNQGLHLLPCRTYNRSVRHAYHNN